ncbi:class I SAM-dependent methyltransferase [Flavobacterium cerinum]|uniref:Class I SAM-dependent methyltransferase n=1 Tax=Flavobacterium cerinum TaxID=2502784 RepID=A0ABY5INL2_9FLAO|nr:class I SAM-dependent methyltransferase [Flavobacterium cerinum]UUC44431.1 class I SAM-dependent methyltransferase [Flavobacterium cerinum]
MITALLKPEIQDFINQNYHTDLKKLALTRNPFPEISWPDLLNQLQAKNKAKDKLPTWFKTENILYPQKISIEQTSSEQTAAYKATLITGKSLIDLTGGFGIDDYYFAQHFDRVTHCEINPELSALVAHNYSVLNSNNIECRQGDSHDTLRNSDTKWDWIYIDPSRRNDAKGKVFMLRDCLPNVPDSLDFYFQYTDNILIKTAPLLDIKAGLSELRFVAKIHVVALENEVKELLWEIRKGHSGPITINAVALTKEGEIHFSTSDDADSTVRFSAPKNYLYEPNSAILKTGAFDAVSAVYKVGKLHSHSHLYTSDTVVDFPGRRFKIESILPYQKSEIKAHIEGKQLNVTTRNFPLSVEELRKKWKIKDGGTTYCFFTTDINNEKIIVICSKI